MSEHQADSSSDHHVLTSTVRLPVSAEEFVAALNNVRFEVQQLFREIIERLKQLVERDTTVLELEGLGLNIDLEEEDHVRDLLTYMTESASVNSFLPEFCYRSRPN